MKHFKTETLFEILNWLKAEVAQLQPGENLSFQVPNPGLGSRLYAGELFETGGRTLRHRGYKTWVDTAELLGCRMLTPKQVSDDSAMILIGMEKLDSKDSFHENDSTDITEKYGVTSRFSRISKLEEPTFLSAFTHALERVGLSPGNRILDLGVNTADSFELIRRVCFEDTFSRLQLVGVDYSESAISTARKLFQNDNCLFYKHDINHLDDLDLGSFDLLISVGTLHSPGIENSKKLFMNLVQHQLSPGGAVILGFPNSRWTDGENVYGAKAKNYAFPEMSVLLKDLAFYRRYLNQHKFRVTLTGKSYIFLTATAFS